jgi:hypothetical protein
LPAPASRLSHRTHPAAREDPVEEGGGVIICEQCHGVSCVGKANMGMGQNLAPLVNIKIAGKWMFIPLKMVLIVIDPYPYHKPPRYILV